MNWDWLGQGKPERILRELIAIQREEITVLRHLNDSNRERIDRLTEALARKANVDLIMPQPPPPPVVPTKPMPNPWKDPNPITLDFSLVEKGATK